MFIPDDPQFFDPDAEFAVTGGRLPHWDQPGIVVFITFRTWDSLPKAVVEGFLKERATWLLARGIDPNDPDWQTSLANIPPHEQAAFHRHCSARWEDSLDGCHGACVLRDSANAELVAKSLLHFDGARYSMFDFVVMPNHVHILAAFARLGAMKEQCRSWKHFTGTRLNEVLGRKGRFWEPESFDHLVRSDSQFETLRDYLAANPPKAKLNIGEYRHYSRDLSSSAARDVHKTRLAEQVGHTPEDSP